MVGGIAVSFLSLPLLRFVSSAEDGSVSSAGDNSISSAGDNSVSSSGRTGSGR